MHKFLTITHTHARTYNFNILQNIPHAYAAGSARLCVPHAVHPQMPSHNQNTDDSHWRQVRELLKQVGLSSAELDACRQENRRLEKLVEELQARVEVWATTRGGGVVLERSAFEALELSREEFKHEAQSSTLRLAATEERCAVLSDTLETMTKEKQNVETELAQTKEVLKAYSDDLVATWTEKVEHLDAENAELQETLNDAKKTYTNQLERQEAELAELRDVVQSQQDIIESKKSEVNLEQALRTLVENDHRYALEHQPLLRLAEEQALMRGRIAEMETNERLLKEERYSCALQFPSQVAPSLIPSERTLSDLSPRYNLERRIEAVPRVFGSSSVERAGSVS
eukprot:GEMP01055291.1.p1 GENE.GEMP01055291.1~~GEMP01055291.1.p1  ORF type:complete len:342 (+),score=92.10 GEMP01055291.1:67-1092(+)